MLKFFMKLGSCWKPLTNATRSSILAVAMVLNTSLCLFRKISSATCFMILYVQSNKDSLKIMSRSKGEKRDHKNMKSVNFEAGNWRHWVRTFDSMAWIPCFKIDKFSYFYGLSSLPLNVTLISKSPHLTVRIKLWNKLHWKFFWKNTETYSGPSWQLRWSSL